MYYVYISCLIVICVVSQNINCNYGGFLANSDNNNKCMFNCELSGRYVDISTLSFNFIKEQCMNIKTASKYNPTECNSLSDLLWSTTICGCPSCKCSTRNYEEITISQIQRMNPEKLCLNCTCSHHSWDQSITSLVYECDTLLDIDDPEEWDEFRCPPNTCTHSDGYIKKATDSWFEKEQLECTTFCYCNGHGNKTCLNGFSNIMSSSNHNLVNKFIIRCADYIEDCLDQPSRMFADCSYYSCPKCDCGSHEVGDEWYTEYQDYSDMRQGTASCTKCTCIENTNGNYADCHDVDEYIMGYGSCPPDESDYISCHQQHSATAGVATLSTINCGAPAPTLSTPYCQWSYTVNTSYSDNTPYDWGCGSGTAGLLCEALASNKCVLMQEHSVYDTDCNGGTDTYWIKKYLYCCNTGDNCNHKIIDTSECETDSTFSEIRESGNECQYGDNGVYKQYACDDGIDLTCSNLREIWKARAMCTCQWNEWLYDKLGDASKALLEREINHYLTTASSRWNDALDCDISFKCNFTTDKSSKTHYFMAILCMIIVIIINN